MDGISVGMIGLFIGTWTWIATLTYKVGKANGDISTMKEKVDLIFAKMFKNTNNGEIAELRNSVMELEKIIKSSNLNKVN